MQRDKDSYQVLGVDISASSKGDFFQTIERRLQDNSPKTPPLFIVTVNPEIVVQTIIDNDFKNILSQSSFNTADGVGISWAVKFLYGQQVERITGSDSMEELCRLSARNGQSVFLYGALPEVARKAAQKLTLRIDNLNIAGIYSPKSPEEHIDHLPTDIRQNLQSASVIFVALGAPAQEKWIYNNIHKLPSCKVIIGIGGSFDFIAGQVKRAPSVMRKTGLEWVYRLYQQPTRYRRMLKLPLFALNVILLKSITNHQKSGVS